MPDTTVNRAISSSQKSRTLPVNLLRDLRGLIASARQDVARQVNSTLVLLHWRIGKRIRQDILKEKRADYGAMIVSALGRQLAIEHGQGFSEKNLWRMVQFAEVFPQEQIVATLSRQCGIRVASYWTRLLPRKLLQHKLHTALIHAREQFSMHTKALPQVL
jgi:hypothetical protein